uniref:DENN domain-containing protein 2C-like n=1 Tax=Myxine glutinosa TaxID=7769 RepID=UPI00358E0C44
MDITFLHKVSLPCSPFLSKRIVHIQMDHFLVQLYFPHFDFLSFSSVPHDLPPTFSPVNQKSKIYFGDLCITRWECQTTPETPDLLPSRHIPGGGRGSNPPPKLAAPLVEDLITCTSRASVPGSLSLKETVSNAFLHFHVRLVGTYPRHVHLDKHGRRILNQYAFRKAFPSRITRHFMKVFMQTQAFQGFIGERETGTPTQEIFEQRVRDFLSSETGS